MAGPGLIKNIIEQDRLVPTLRTLKLLLSHPDVQELHRFLADLPEDILIDLYECAMGTGHDLKKMYKNNFELLETIAGETSVMKNVFRATAG